MSTNARAAMLESSASPAEIDWADALEQHGRWLRTVVRARLGEPQAVDDVMQDVSLAAIAQQAPLHQPDRVAAWLYRLAIRQTLLYRRRQGRTHKLVARYAQAIDAAPSRQEGATDPLGWLLDGERNARVREALERLGERDRQMLWLKYTEQWSYRQMADHLGLSPSAIEARLHRARQRLRELLEDHAAEDEGRP